MKTQTFKKKNGAMLGHAVAMLSATLGEVIIVAPTKSAVVRVVKSLGLAQVDMKEVKHVAIKSAEGCPIPKLNGAAQDASK